jgi:hypothetical protein
MAWREIDDDVTSGEMEPAGPKGTLNPVPRLFNRPLGKTDDGGAGQACCDMTFNGYRMSLQAHNCSRENCCGAHRIGVGGAGVQLA